MTGTAIKTNGEGTPCPEYLNTTVTLADAWRRDAKGLPLVDMTTKPLPTLVPPFAGYDPKEREL